jgi:hypothetical protein
MHSDPIVRRMHACVLSRVPVCLWGEPGTGKTARTLAYARARKLHIERWLLSRTEPIDIKPRIYNGRVIVCDPPEIERLKAHAEGGSLLFLDELNRASRETEGAALDLIDAPPPGVAVIAACNPPSRGQAARSLGAAAANRFCHLSVAVDAVVWANAQIGGWGDGEGELSLPSADALTRGDARARAYVSSFMRKTGGMRTDKNESGPISILENCPDDPVSAGLAWPSTRTWEHARTIHGVAIALALDMQDILALVSGCVGEGPALEYLAYVQDADLPDPEELLAKPEGFTIDPARIDRTIAAVTAVAGAVKSQFTDGRWRAAWAIINRCFELDQSEAAIVLGDLLMLAYREFGRSDAAAQTALTKPAVLMSLRMAAILGQGK